MSAGQVSAALEVAERVASGALSVEGGVAFMVSALGVSEAVARGVLSGAKPLEIVA